jgi:hypothetical protein
MYRENISRSCLDWDQQVDNNSNMSLLCDYSVLNKDSIAGGRSENLYKIQSCIIPS